MQAFKKFKQNPKKENKLKEQNNNKTKPQTI